MCVSGSVCVCPPCNSLRRRRRQRIILYIYYYFICTHYNVVLGRGTFPPQHGYRYNPLMCATSTRVLGCRADLRVRGSRPPVHRALTGQADFSFFTLDLILADISIQYLQRTAGDTPSTPLCYTSVLFRVFKILIHVYDSSVVIQEYKLLERPTQRLLRRSIKIRKLSLQ